MGYSALKTINVCTAKKLKNALQTLIISMSIVPHMAMAISYVSGTDESYFYAHPMLDTVDVRNLQSRPGAANCLYLASGGVSKRGYASHIPGAMEVLITFNSVAEDYYPFDVNITTSAAVYNTYAPEHRSYGVYNSTPGGQSYIDAFGNGSNLAVSDFGAGIKTPAHEFGHLMGVDHDNGYMMGDWPLSPVMGNSMSYNGPVTESGSFTASPLAHWYNGYRGGDKSDDIGRIGGVLGFIPDEQAADQVLTVAADGSVTPENNPGGIQSNTDTDEWSFTLEGKTMVNFLVKPRAIRSPNLFVGLEIVDSNGITVATGTPHALYGLESKIDNVTLPAGNYYLIIDGIAPSTTWFTDYGSFGPYRIFGSLAPDKPDDHRFNAAVPFLLLF